MDTFVSEMGDTLMLYTDANYSASNACCTKIGRNPKGFRSRFSGWQELVLMRLELDAG